jgi:hypothetical protein
VPGAVRLGLADGVPLLRPEDQVFQAMLDGWRNQQLARNLARSTVEGRKATVRAFADYVSACPWAWSPAMADEWPGDLRSLRDLKRTTIRSYSEAVRAFCHFVTDPLYGWAETCEERFGTHPVQVVHEWNTAVHVQDNESDPGKHAFTRAELPGQLHRRAGPGPACHCGYAVRSIDVTCDGHPTPRQITRTDRGKGSSHPNRADRLHQAKGTASHSPAETPSGIIPWRVLPLPWPHP